MSITTIGVNSPQAVKRWATQLALDVDTEAYFTRFTGKDQNSIIQRKVELEEDAGDRIQYDLSMRMRGAPVFGDNLVEGTEESMQFYQDEVRIDQVRKGTSAGGRMSRKRTLHNLRTLARENAGIYLSEWLDEGYFCYLSGDATLSALNQDSKFGTAFAGNAITAPDADHILYGGAATSKASITASDKMSVALLERVSVKPAMMSAVNPDVVKMQPVSVDGAKRFVVLMSPFQAHALRTETGDLSWSKIQQSLATAEGRASPICKGGLGMINNMVLHEHESVRRFGDYGAGSNVAAARALLLAKQAGVVAYGAAGNGTRMTWVEKNADADNLVNIYCGMILGMKKTTFDGKDFGVCAIDTACKDPNA
jgi:N4-gp56 family major capsid protein